MKDEGPRSIFRIEAIMRNSRGGGEAILPQFSSPRIIWLLWTFIVFAIAASLLLWLLRIPIYTKAIAVALPNEYTSSSLPRSSTLNGTHESLMAVLIPTRNAGDVRVGQRVFWSSSKTGHRITRTVIAVEPSVQSPDSLSVHLGLREQATASVTEPSVIAFVDFGPTPDELRASAYAGSVYHAEVETGTKRVISLLPFFSRLIGN